MDPSAIPLMPNTEDNLDNSDNVKAKDIVIKLDHSPARSSVKSLKNTTGPKINRFGCNKFSAKADSKSNSSLGKNVNQKDSSAAQSIETKCFRQPMQTKNRCTEQISPKSAKSSNSLTTSRIPSMKKTTGNNSKSTIEKKPPGLKRDQQKKKPTQKIQPENKQTDVKQQQIIESNYKTSTGKSESNSKTSTSRSESNSKTGTSRMELPLQDETMPTDASMSSQITSDAISNQLKRISKCQSARSNSEAPVSCAKERSASTVSSRSTPCTGTNGENETNLRKMISTAGDYKSHDSEKEQNENLPPTEIETETSKASESVDEFKYKVKSYMDQWFSSLKNELTDPSKSDLSEVEHLQMLKSNDVLSFIDDWCANTRGSDVDKLKKEMEEGHLSFKNLERKYNDLVLHHKEERIKLEKELVEKAEADIVQKDEYIKELQKKYKVQEKHVNTLKTTTQNLEKEKEFLQTDNDQLREELKTCRDCIATTNKKLHDCEQQLKQERKDLKCKSDIIKSLENDLADKMKLETDLAEATKKLEELQEKAHNECVEHMKQISELTNQVSYLESDKEALEQKNEKLEQEINDLEKVREILLETDNKLQALQIEFDNKEKSLEINPNYAKEVQLELAKLRQSEAEKSREIDKLKIELSKTQFNICQLEQQVQRDQQLLEVRSGLINSLQTNEKTHRIHIEELFAQVGEKNNTINELNCELQTKSEEFRNLFTTLSAKQMEVANQEHIIKLLEESNERSQMLRVKQEEKIGRLEEELAHLKQTIAIYQANLLSGKSGRHIQYTPVLSPPNMDYNENLYYYVSQRKRKRQVDINVKKYEA